MASDEGLLPPWAHHSVRPCPACEHRSSVAAGEKYGFALRTCRRCKTIFTAVLAEPDALDTYDDYYGDSDLQCPAFIHRRLDQLVASLSRYRSTNRWLDVGFGAGALMQAAARAGWEVHGTEVAERAWREMSEAGFQVQLGELSTVDLPGEGFDVVTLIEVVEHVPDPSQLLRAAFDLLRPKGAIYLTTPHARGISGRLLGTGWTVIAPPEHLQIFSVPGVRSLLSRAGYQQSHVETHGANPHELVSAMVPGASRNATTGRDRVASARNLNARMSNSHLGPAIKYLANRGLDVTRLGDTLKVRGVRVA